MSSKHASDIYSEWSVNIPTFYLRHWLGFVISSFLLQQWIAYYENMKEGLECQVEENKKRYAADVNVMQEKIQVDLQLQNLFLEPPKIHFLLQICNNPYF